MKKKASLQAIISVYKLSFINEWINDTKKAR